MNTSPKRIIMRQYIPNGDGDYVSVLLDERCRACNGDGVVYSPEWAAFDKKYPSGSNPPDDPGEWPEGPEELRCVECDGVGLQPTPEGQAILDLVLRYQGGSR